MGTTSRSRPKRTDFARRIRANSKLGHRLADEGGPHGEDALRGAAGSSPDDPAPPSRPGVTPTAPTPQRNLRYVVPTFQHVPSKSPGFRRFSSNNCGSWA